MIYRHGNCVTPFPAKARNLLRGILHVARRGALTETIPRLYRREVPTYNKEMLHLL